MNNLLRISLKLIFVFFLVTAGIHLMAFIGYQRLPSGMGWEALADKFFFFPLGIIFVVFGLLVAFLGFRKELKILLLALIVVVLSFVLSVHHLYVSDFTRERRVKEAKEKAEKQIQEFSVQVLPNTNWVENIIKIYFYNKNDGLFSINIDGSDLKKVFPSDKEIKEYAFSPHGNLLLVRLSWYEKGWVRHDELYVLNISNNQQQWVDSSKDIDHIKWSPDNASILYTKSINDSYKNYIFRLSDSKSFAITREEYEGELYWSSDGKSLYNFKRGYDKCMLMRIPLETLKPEIVSELPNERFCCYPEEMTSGPFVKEIVLDNWKNRFSEDRHRPSLSAIARNGAKLYIENDAVYYQGINGEKRKICTVLNEPDILYINYGGVWEYRFNYEWLPGDNYALMRCPIGILIIEPATGRIGALIKKGNLVGWYSAE